MPKRLNMTRDILLETESANGAKIKLDNLPSNSDPDMTRRCITQLIVQGYISGQVMYDVMSVNLTDKGYTLLDCIRNFTIWNSVLHSLNHAEPSIPLDLLEHFARIELVNSLSR